MNRQARPIANPLVLLREEFDDWAVLFDPDSGCGFGLNPTGVYVWKLADGSRSIDDLSNVIREIAKDVPADVGDHVSSFVDALAAEGLVAFDLERPVNEETADGAETGSLAPSGCDRDDCGPIKIMYEPPQLVYLSQQRASAWSLRVRITRYPRVQCQWSCSGHCQLQQHRFRCCRHVL